MKHKRIRFFLIVCLMLLLSLPAASVEMKKVAQTGFQFLKVDASARGSAMGGAFAAVAQGAEALFWNPAGITEVEGRDIVFGQTSWIADITQYSIGAIMPFGNIGSFGLSFVNMNYGDIPRTIIADNELGYIEDGNYTPGSIAIGLSYAKKFTNKLSIGGTVKYAHESLGSNTIRKPGETASQDVDNDLSSVGFDVGTLYYTGFKDLRLSMSVRNFSTDIEYETESFQMPLTFAIGLAMDVLTLTDIANQKLTIAIDAIHPRDYSERLHVGAEWWIADLLALRAGYKANYTDEGLAAGMGLKADVSGYKLKIDYSYTDMGSFLGNVHRITLGGSF